VATAVLPVLACFLGGATEKWAEAIVVAIAGLLILASPPRVSLGPVANGLLLALVGCAVLAFAPAAWFFQPAWREALVNDFGIPLGTRVSPQPWISAGCLASMAAGASWFYYVATQQLENRSVRRQFRIFAGSVVLLAALCVALYFARTSLPFWHNQRGFGPFPNRNQTANLFGLTALILLACGHDDFRQHKKRWLFWFAGFAILGTAIVLNFSRAGIGLLVVGTAIWAAALALRSRSAGTIAVGVSALLVLLTALLVFGGQTLERFNLRAAEGTGVARDFRWLIFQDALELIRASPWCGIGLGNFEPVFSTFRNASLGQSRALHPESDWFWVAVEMGWPAVVLIVVLAGVLTRRIFPLSEGTAQRFRLAALVCAILFAVHSVVDVAGHRVGSAYAGLFLFALALRRPGDRAESRVLPHLFRLVGAALLVIGVTWLVATHQNRLLPGSVGTDHTRKLARSAHVGRMFHETIAHATQGLAWAPLDWQLYFLRALGKVGAKTPPGDAVEDFRRARFLEPNSFEVPYQEGMAWVQSQPMLTMTAWREALRRAGPQRVELYDRMLSTASQRSRQVQRLLEEYGTAQPDLALALLGRAEGQNFNASLERLLTHDPTLAAFSDAENQQLFSLWAERGDLERLANFVREHPELAALGWRGAAKQKAAAGDFAAAYELVRRHAAAPAQPRVALNGSADQLQRSLIADPRNYEAAVALYQQQMQSGSADHALITVRRVTEQQGCPAYFHFMEAEARAARGEYDRAWGAWLAYEAAARK
jgi:O-antigen ligase